MARFQARIAYIDERIITVEAENEEEAQLKFDEGDWEDEHTADFYAHATIVSLHQVEDEQP